MSNSFDSTTLDTGNEQISQMEAENKRRWEEMITLTDLTGYIRKAWQTNRNVGTYRGSCMMAVPAMSTRPRTSALRVPSTHPAIRNANHR